jgi:hypothetical protein
MRERSDRIIITWERSERIIITWECSERVIVTCVGPEGPLIGAQRGEHQ